VEQIPITSERLHHDQNAASGAVTASSRGPRAEYSVCLASRRFRTALACFQARARLCGKALLGRGYGRAMPERLEVAANGLRFAALGDGPVGGRLALCLHGFPDSAWTWQHLQPDLAAAGFRALAPWMRAHAPTEVPSDGSYGLAALVADAVAPP
jgi:hypothetical protein